MNNETDHPEKKKRGLGSIHVKTSCFGLGILTETTTAKES